VTVRNTAGNQTLTAGTDITVDADATAQVLVQADAGLQTILANGLIDLSADASTVTVNSETADQIITATTGTITFDADNSATITVSANTTQAITATATDIVVDAVDATINVVADTGAQTILANGLIDVNADNSAVTIDATASTQSITATTGNITIDAIDASTVEVTAAGQQDITATAGTIAITADDSDITVQNTAGAQTLTAGTDITMDATDAAAVLVQADSDLQTLIAAGMIDLNADDSVIEVISDLADQVITATTGDISLTSDNGAEVAMAAETTQAVTATAGAINITATDDSAAVIFSTGAQTISAATGVTLTASDLSAAYLFTAATQSVTVTGGNLQVNATDDAEAILIALGNQTIDVTGQIDVTATGADAEAVIGSMTGLQVITSTGTTNITGGTGGEAVVVAINTTLNNAGGVLTGDATIGASGFTETVTINNTGALTVADADAAHVHVIADTGAASITFTGAGSVGGTTDRLVTSTNAYVFTNAGKTLVLDERVGSVTVEGTVGNLNLILTDAAGGTITDAAAFTATTATLQTVNGSINLGANAVQVDTFAGLIAQGAGSTVTYNGTGSTTFANRAISAGIVAGAGVSADAGISITTAGVTTITADLVEVTGTGNIAFTATSLVLDAENAETGGDYNTADLDAVGTIRTADGTQTYDAPVVLLTNTHIEANGAVDTVTFNGTINGPGGLEIGSTPVFNDFIGDTTALAYLILNSDSFFIADSGNPALGSATVNLSGSFINNGTMTLGDPSGGVNQNFTFIVDSGTAAVGGSIFQGGMIANHISQDAVNGSFITVFGSAFGSISFDNIPLGTSLYESYTFNPGFSYTDPLTVFTPGFVYFKGPQTITFESERERLEREANEKASSLAYDGSVIPEGLLALAGKLAEAPGTAGGITTSTYDIVPAGQVETFTQTVFSNTIILP